jgi:ubiquinone/menaquinone biosynthesis C-methylase UbiE
MRSEDVMKRVTVVGLVTVSAVIIAVALVVYCKIVITWQGVTAIGALVAAITAIRVYLDNKYWNTYRYLADVYYDILRIELEHPEFHNPEKTRKYEEVWRYTPKMYNKYDAYVMMCWAHAFDIYDTEWWFKNDFIKLYASKLEIYNRLHGVWLQNNTPTFGPDFVDFVKLNKWRDYLDESEADRLRWSYVVEDYDETILNPFLLRNKYLYKYLFSWNNVPENDSERLLKLLRDDFDIGWAKEDTEIRKSRDDRIISISKGKNLAEIMMYEKKEKATLKISGGRTHDLKVKAEDGKLNIYKHNNPLFDYIKRDRNEMKHKVVADFGCGNGKLVEFLCEEKFENVYGIDYSDNMLEMAKKRCNSPNVTYIKRDMTNLEEEMKKLKEEIYGKIAIAFSINSILPRNPKDTPIILHEIYKTLNPGGLFIAILPSFDTVLYLKELWYKRRVNELKELWHKDRIKKLGSSWKARRDTNREFHKCRKLNKRKHLYADDGSNVQRFIRDNEIQHLLKKAGFELKQKEKVTYPWELCKKYNYDYFPEKKEIWDWFVVAKKPEDDSK